jgi:hypothetical protein
MRSRSAKTTSGGNCCYRWKVLLRRRGEPKARSGACKLPRFADIALPFSLS